MSKQVKALIACAVVLVLVGGILAGILLLVPEENGDSASSSASSQAAEALVNKNISELESITITNEDDSYMATLATSGNLVINGLEDFAKNDEAYDELNAIAASITYSKIIDENPADPSEYGLDPAAATMDVTYTDGLAYTLEVGVTCPGTEFRYARKKGEDAVFLLNTSVECLFYTKAEYVSKNIFTAEGDTAQVDVQDITLGGTVRPEEIRIQRNSNTSDTNPLRLMNHIITAPVKTPARNELATAFSACMGTIDAVKVVAVEPTEEQLAEYGLADPYSSAVFTVEAPDISSSLESSATESSSSQAQSSEEGAEEKMLTSSGSLVLGGKDEDGNYYAMEQDGRVVYTVRANSVPWAEWQMTDIINASPALVDITYIDSVEVKASGLDVTFTPSIIENEETGERELADSNSEKQSQANGEDIPDTTMFYWYQALQYVTVDGLSDKEPTGEPILTYKLNIADGAGSIEYKFYQDTDRTCLLTIEGIEGELPVYTVQSKKLESFIQKTKDAMEGKEIDSTL